MEMAITEKYSKQEGNVVAVQARMSCSLFQQSIHTHAEKSIFLIILYVSTPCPYKDKARANTDC